MAAVIKVNGRRHVRLAKDFYYPLAKDDVLSRGRVSLQDVPDPDTGNEDLDALLLLLLVPFCVK